MKYFYVLFAISLFPFQTQAQVLLQDFSNLSNNSIADVYGGFGGGQTAANTAVADPVDANNTVRQVTVTTGGDVWKGIFIRPQTHYIDLTANQTVSLKVYSTAAIHLRGIIQVGQSGQTNIDAAASTVAHTGSGWETLSFTFTGATGEWGELAIRTSVDAAGALNNTAAYTAYFDDLSAVQGSAIPVPAIPSDSPAAPTKDAADVISVYSDAYTDIATEYNPNWGQSGSVSTNYDVGGNNLMVYSNFNYQGTLLTPTDMAAMEYLHLDIWVASDDTTNTYQVTPIGGGETLVDITTTPGSWSSVDIPVTSFTAVNFSSVDKMKFAGGSGKSIYLDNIYFWKGSTVVGQSSPTTAAPDPPARNSADVVSFYSDSYTAVSLGEYFPSWSEVTVTDNPIDGDNIWKMSSMNFASVTQYAGIDLSQMEKMYIDYWTAQDVTGAKLFVKLVDTNNSTEVLLDLGEVVPGSWQTIEVDLVAQNASNIDLSTVTQFLIDPSENGDTFFIDNWYFAKNTFDPTPPVTQDINETIERNSVKEIQLLGTDVNTNHVLTYEITTEPSNGSYSLDNNIVTYTPNTDFTGTDTFTDIANDGTFDSSCKISVRCVGNNVIVKRIRTI